MEKFYIMRNNQFIIYPGTVRECNITEEEKECKYCIRKPKTKCGHYNPKVDYPACDWFTFNNKWREIKEEDIMTYL